ncbi:AI-2E family transporter [Methylocaldum szegediense]|uniref:AI-2E family transporter n=1 Tax=Methylocaldum szegediense TaxID=73780 RepID=UPI00041162E7|nr:AI-2E family transporter [Methylocaldum szegediense]
MPSANRTELRDKDIVSITSGRLTIDKVLRFITLGFFLSVLVFLIFRVMSTFLEPIGWAVILVYSTWPLHVRLSGWLEGRNALSALIMTLLFGTLLVIPFIALTVVLQAEIVEFFLRLPAWLEQKPELPGWLSNVPVLGAELQFIFDQFEDLQGLMRRYLLPWLSRVSGRVVGMLEGVGYLGAKLFFTVFLMFFVYRDGHRLIYEVRQGLRLALGERADEYLSTTEVTVKAVVYGIVLTAIAQGIMAGIGYWIVGIRAPVLLAAFTTFFALIPFGTVTVWVSASVWLLLNGEYSAGIILFLWGALVVSWVDNLIRPLVISRTTRIPFVIVMFGVLGGLTSFGFIGLFVGPVILAVGMAVWHEWLESAPPYRS